MVTVAHVAAELAAMRSKPMQAAAAASASAVVAVAVTVVAPARFAAAASQPPGLRAWLQHMEFVLGLAPRAAKHSEHVETAAMDAAAAADAWHSVL